MDGARSGRPGRRAVVVVAWCVLVALLIISVRAGASGHTGAVIRSRLLQLIIEVVTLVLAVAWLTTLFIQAGSARHLRMNRWSVAERRAALRRARRGDPLTAADRTILSVLRDRLRDQGRLLTVGVLYLVAQSVQPLLWDVGNWVPVGMVAVVLVGIPAVVLWGHRRMLTMDRALSAVPADGLAPGPAQTYPADHG